MSVYEEIEGGCRGSVVKSRTNERESAHGTMNNAERNEERKFEQSGGILEQ
jgi:hypothetical protein